MSPLPRRIAPESPQRRGWCPSLARPMPTGDGLLARVHPPLGILSPAQLRAMAEGARRFGNGHVDVTSRGNLQVRGVREETAPGLAAMLDEVGLGDRRADGGPQRLTLTSPLAGLDQDAPCDVPALAAAIEETALGIEHLPAKTLIAIAGDGLGQTEADIVVEPAGGGRLRLILASDSAPQRRRIEIGADVAVAALAAMLTGFVASGRRRMRDLSAMEGAGVLAAAGHDDLDNGCRAPSPLPTRWGKGTGHLVVSGAGPQCEDEGVSTEVPRPSRPPHPRLPPRRADDRVVAALSPPAERGDASADPDGGLRAGLSPLGNLFVVAVEAPFGRCVAEGLDRLADTAEACGQGDIRTSPSRGFVLACDNEKTAREALRVLSVAGFVTEPDDPRRAVAACPGAPACASGSTPTLADAARLAEAFRPLAALGLRAHVSGCAKGCAHPGDADLTLVGADGRYGIVLGGTPGALPATHLPFEAALERVRRAASTLSLDDAFRTTP